MNRFAFIGALFVAAVVSCSETNYYTEVVQSGATSANAGGEGGAPTSAPDATTATSTTTTSGSGGMPGSGGEGGAVTHGTTSTPSASTSADVAAPSSASSATSSASGEPEYARCGATGVEFADPCDGGVCSRDSVCRPLARCKVAAHGWERVIDCLDPNLRSMAVYINGPARLEQGCMKEPDGSRYKPMSCPPGDKCVINLFDWTVLPSSESNGYCE